MDAVLEALRESFGAFIAFGFLMLLLLLRIDAERFGAAEYDEAARGGRPPALRRRLGWYIVGLGLVAAAAYIHPRPASDLFLVLGDRLQVIVYGFGYGLLGTAQAVAFAILRYRHLRLPEVRSYPGSVLNTVATAFIDEATFRGLLLGFILLAGVDPTVGNVIQAFVYTLATRVGAPGRDRYMLVLVLVIGLASGWVTIQTGGIGAAFLGHAITRVALFLTTGHAGQVARRGREEEDVENQQETPDGWNAVGARESSRSDR
ncbi:MAG TPA: CPBP family intramembrane glutamic endopeptidase [Candidatus Limnocylindria bacterium]|nr:CPBP family intramembrane glutamic endopeptidase [Candidatus Limnocylindria bacterium]